MSRPALPPFDSLVAFYPSPTAVTAMTLKTHIGGGIDDTRAPPDQQWLGGVNGDTCTIRMSRAFNYAGGLIPLHPVQMRTAKGGDYRNYGFASREFDAWLRAVYGPPDIEVKGPPVSRERFLGRKGVISFDITFGLNADGRSRALGHVDLWDGRTFYDELDGTSRPDRDFFNIAKGVALWLTDGKAMLHR